MAPAREGRRAVDGVRTVRAWIVVDFHVVHIVRDHHGDLVGREACADVLTVLAVTLSAETELAIQLWGLGLELDIL